MPDSLSMAWPLLAAGMAAGLLGGMLGAGGGLIVVPALHQAFAALQVDASVRSHLTVGTALAAVVPMALLGARTHQRLGNIDTAMLRRMFMPVLAASVLSGLAAGWFPARLLALAFALAAVLACCLLLAKGRLKPGTRTIPPAAVSCIGAVIGALSTLVGIGGATLTVPVLHMLRLSMPAAIGTASVLGAAIGLPGALAFAAGGWGDARLPPWSLGYVHLPAALLLVPAAACGAPLGARLTRGVDERVLRAAFVVLLALAAWRMLRTAH